MQSPDRSRNSQSQDEWAAARQPDQPPTSSLTPERVLVFVDMLGFAALTEANPIDPRALAARNRPLEMIFDSVFGPKNPLTEAFSRFHYSLEAEIRLAEMGHPLTAITFSDSAFVATTYLCEAAAFAVNLIQSMLSQSVPVRIGIAFGSFAALRFRSDISPDGGDHAAQFLGTGVVRACQAEKCGIKGMRILLHPSVQPLLSDSNHSPNSPPIGTVQVRPLECPEAERANRVGVRYELNYWDLATMKERSAWRGLQDMWKAAPEHARGHYQATAEAVNRMRIARGEATLTDLHRRTLPRRRR